MLLYAATAKINRLPSNPPKMQKELYEIDPKINNDLEQALNEENTEKAKSIINNLTIIEQVDFFTTASPEQRHKFVKITGDNFNPQVIVELDSDLKNLVIEDMGIERAARAINLLEIEDMLYIITDLEESLQEQILGFISEEKRGVLRGVLSYPEESAGRLIRKDWLTVQESWKINQVINLIKINKNIPERIHQIFVVDQEMKPVGTITLSKIIRSPQTATIKEIMESNIKLIKADMDQEKVGYIFRKYELSSAPVVNNKGYIIGIITMEDIIGIVQEEAEEDFLHFGGISETDIHLTHLQTIKQRFPWLFINILLSIFTSVIIGFFEATLEQAVALAILMPIIASISGNSGIQTVTVTVRSIATRELKRINVLRIVGKEIIVSVINGSILAILSFCIVMIRFEDFKISLLFAVSIIVTFLLASLAGSSIPLLLNLVGIDPAIASSVILTTFTDIVSFAVFLGLATFFLL